MNKNRIHKTMKNYSLICLITLLLSACVSTELPELAQDDVPTQWQYTQSSDNVWPELEWWQNFNSSELSDLMVRLEESSLDLENNARNLEQAQITLRDAGFDLYPTPVLDVGLTERYSGSRPNGESYTDDSVTTADIGLSIGYTDILSKPARYDAAVARYDSSIANIADVRLNIQGTAASTYFRILLTRDLITAAEQNLENAEAISRIIQARVDAGTVTPIDALQQRIAVERQRNNLKSLRQTELSARASLATLLASSVNELQINEDSLAEVNVPIVQAGLPSELLLRRPDLVEAEANLRQFRANVDLARLSFFPNLSLTGGASLVSGSLSGLLDEGDLSTSLIGSVVQTLLDNGARSRSLRSSHLDLETSLANYRRSVITAFNDIEVSLSNIELLKSLAQVAAEDLARAEEAFRIAGLRYTEGVTGFQTLLTTQDTLFSVRNNFLDSKLSELNAAIALYQSLGGGWKAPE